MAKKDGFITTPAEGCAGAPPVGYKGGPGVYDGEEGWPKRTPSPNAVPEKVKESIPTTKE